MPTVLVPAPFQGPTAGQSEIEVDASTLRAAIQAVDAQFPGFSAQIFDASGGLHSFVKLACNGEVTERGDLDRAVGADDQLEVLSPVSGG